MATGDLIEHVQGRILQIRGQKVMLDADLARIYGVSTKRLNQQVQRNQRRFPPDFKFRLTADEASSLRLQSATLKSGRGRHRKHLPYAFTEHGAVMLASVLRTPVAIRASVQIARAFIGMRRFVAAHKELAEKLAELERAVKTHDSQIQGLFSVIHQLMSPPAQSPPRIGFQPP